MESLNIRLANDSDSALWNSFVFENSGTELSGGCLTPYHRYEWRSIISAAYNGWESFYIICASNDHNNTRQSKEIIKGILPVFFLKKSFSPAKIFISLPYCTHAGTAALNDTVRDMLIKKSLSLMRENKIPKLEIREAASYKESQDTHKYRLVTQIAPLSNSIDEQWENIGYNCRRAVKKALKNGLTVERQKSNIINTFYRIYLSSMKKFGTPPHPKKMFSTALESMGDDATILIVRTSEGTPVGAMFLFKCGVIAHDPWVATLSRYNKLYVSDLLYWEAMQWAIEKGCIKYDMGRSTYGSGVHRFKKKWGAKDILLKYHTILSSGEAISSDTLITGKKIPRIIFSFMWSNIIPTPIANLTGPLIRKFIF